MKKVNQRRLKSKGAYYPGGIRGRGAYQRVLRGRGGFFDDIGGMLKSVAGPAIGALGGLADSVIPGAGQVANGIRKLAGLGAYTPVHSNAILAQPVPKVGSMADKGIRYTHQEFLGDVTGSVDWELTQFHVNPGLPEVFPWLSGIAGNFQKYRIDGLVFYLRSTSSVAIADTTNLGLGTVLGGFQYNVYDKAPSSKPDFLSLSGALSGKPSEDHIYPMECDTSKNVFGNLLVRTVGVSDDLQKYDHAVFNLATVGFPGDYYLGELWVSYNVTLMAPKVEQVSNYLITNMASGHTGDPVHPLGGYLYFQPRVDDPVMNLNEMGLTLGEGSEGEPCMLVPSGTAGHYLLSLSGNLNLESGPVSQPVVACLDNTGTVAVDGNTDGPIAVTFTQQMIESGHYAFMFQASIRIEALPDKPLKLALYSLTQVTNGTFHLTIQRLPDKLFAQEIGSTVTLRQKVARRRKRVVMSNPEGKESSQVRPGPLPAAASGYIRVTQADAMPDQLAPPSAPRLPPAAVRVGR